MEDVLRSFLHTKIKKYVYKFLIEGYTYSNNSKLIKLL